MRKLFIQPINKADFAPFGDILDCAGDPDKIINQGKCGRYHDRATLDFSDGRAGISLFKAELRTLPLTLDMMERHPDGSQCFVPMSNDPFLVIVAQDTDGAPATPLAFRTNPGEAINFHRNTWHGVLTAVAGNGLFAVIDRIGTGDNLEEHWFDSPYQVVEPEPHSFPQ